MDKEITETVKEIMDNLSDRRGIDLYQYDEEINEEIVQEITDSINKCIDNIIGGQIIDDFYIVYKWYGKSKQWWHYVIDYDEALELKITRCNEWKKEKT